MLPVLLSIGSFPITSFGVFTIIAFLASLYVIWRLAIVYDFDKERIIDLFIFTCLFSLIGARLSFIVTHLNFFHSLVDIISIARFPGFYFWGGFYTSILFLIFILRRRQTSFWQVTDIASVGLLLGLSLGSFGCLLSSCQYGYPTSWLSVHQSGLIEPRFPIQIVISILFITSYFILWYQSLKFHLTGVITAKTLLWLSAIIFITDFFRADESHQLIFTPSQFIAIATFVIGVAIYSLITKTSPVTIVLRSASIVTNSRKRRKTFDNLTDDLTEIPTQLTRTQNKLLRHFNIRRTPKSL